MSRFLAQSGVDCRLLTVDTGLSAERMGFLGKNRVVALSCLIRRFYVPRFSLKKVKALVIEADVIHLMGHWSILNILAYYYIRKFDKSYVVCPAGALPIFGKSMWIKRIFNAVVGNRIVVNATACIAVTPSEIASFDSYGVNPANIRVIPNGVSKTEFLSKNDSGFREKYGLDSRRPFILFVGRLNLIKGPDILLKAFGAISSQISGFDLVFVGPDGGMLGELRRLVMENELESRVHFLGYLGGADKSCAYHAAALLAIPSRQEAMSIVALEAGVCGTPVLLTDQCGFNQLAENGGGWVVPANIEGLRRGLFEVLSFPERLEAASVVIKKYVESNYSWSVVVREYRKLYSVLMESRPQ